MARCRMLSIVLPQLADATSAAREFRAGSPPLDTELPVNRFNIGGVEERMRAPATAKLRRETIMEHSPLEHS